MPLWLATTQSLLLAAMKANEIPRSLTTLQQDQMYFGYVASVSPKAAFVRFLGSQRLIIPRGKLSLRRIEDANEVVSVGQSVCVRVEMDNQQKVCGSLRCVVNDDTQALFIATYQEERFRLLEGGFYEEEAEENNEMEESEEGEESEEEKEDDSEESEEEKEDNSEKEESKSEDEKANENDDQMEEESTPFNWKTCPLGSMHSATIHSLRPYGVIVELENGCLGFAQSPLHTEGVTLKEGMKVTARILDANPSLELYDVTLNPRYHSITQEEVRQRSRKMSDCDLGIAHGQKVETVILLKKEDYFIASMSSHNNDLLVVSAASYNTVKDTTPDLEPGTSVACMVVTDLGFGELVVQARDAFREKLSEDEADRIRAFFGSVRAGRLYNEAVSRDTIPQRTDVQLSNNLRGSVFRVRVTQLFGTRAQVTLLGVQVSGYYHAYIQKMDMNNREVREGESFVAK